ncbi:hypothetical protein Tco_0467583 [Tanacetum coccineum]
MPKPQFPLKESYQENPLTTLSNNDSLQPHLLLLGDSCATNVKQAFIPPQSVNQHTQPSFPHLVINPHVASVLHAQTPPSPQGDNQTQPPLPPSPSREMLINDINQLQDLSNLLAMHLSQRNTPSSPYSPNLPHTLNLNQVEHHIGTTRAKHKVFHGGTFTPSPNRKYFGGKVQYVDLLDIEWFTIDIIHNIVKMLKYDPRDIIRIKKGQGGILMIVQKVLGDEQWFTVQSEDEGDIDPLRPVVNLNEDDLEVIDYDSFESDVGDDDVKHL